MIICPTCGAQNDPGNRFCDQCGTRLEPALAKGPMVAPTLPASEVALQPASAVAPVAALSCPNCGAAVIPGQAFCDECGFPLNTTVSDTVASEAPTLVYMPEDDTATAAADDVTLIDTRHESEPEQPAPLPVPSAMDDSAATLITSPGEPPAAPPVAESIVQPAPTAPSDLEAILTPPPEFQPLPQPASKPASKTMPDLDSILAPPLPAPQPEPQPELEPEPIVVPTEPAVLPEPPAPEQAPPVAVVAEEAPPGVAPAEEAPPVAVVAEEAPPGVAPAADQAQRQRLEGLIAAHRETITQYEQMLTRYPEGTAPPFLVAGLDEARKALAQAESDLAALAPVSPAPDPAEVARLEGLITAHRETIAQYQQMHDRYPAGAAPAFLKAGLDEAQKALEQTEAELAALRGEAVVPAPVSASVAPPPAAASAAAPVPATTPPAPAPRLVLSDGQELPLPTNKTEIIVGREDPVSQIFPEIDLTQHGGESGGVSRQHARISQQNGQWTIVDLDSTNYTRVDGARIAPNTPTPIHDGTQIHFGRVAVVFRT